MQIYGAWRNLFSCLSGQERCGWRWGTKAGHPFISPAIPFLRHPPLPAGSLSLWHLVPILTEITGTSAASVSPVTWPSVVSKDCLVHFQVIWIGWGGLPRSAAGIIFVCPNLWNKYPGRTWTHETWGGKAANNGTLTMTTGGEGWKVRATGSCVKGQGLQVAPSSQGWKVKCCLQLQKKRRRTGREQDWPPSRLPAETQLRLSRLCLPSGCCSRLQPLADSGGAKIREETERGSVEKY